MSGPLPLYGQSLALLTDLYQLTMAYGHWKLGSVREAAFNLHFRKNPFKGGYAIACGLAHVLEYLERLRFDDSDLAYLETLEGADGRPLFERGFLDYLGALEFKVDIDAMPEGTAVFPLEPLVRVSGPLVQCQLLETPLLALVNFQTLVATKASRVAHAAQGEPVLEFGLRRAQGPDGGVTASRAAFVGGAASTSNVLAGKLYGIPVRGTHAHSWVMSFDDEKEAFLEYAKAMPNNCVFLVDTYDSLEGVRHAVEVGRWLRERGHELLGIRLDSGDLAWLSIEARRILDEGGFSKAYIVASNDLDEHLIESLKLQGAKITVWGVGTKLATAYDQPALGGVYKLSATRLPGEPWSPRLKLSEQVAKISIPGVLQVSRYVHDGEFVADVLHLEGEPPAPGAMMIDPMDPLRRRHVPAAAVREELLVPVVRGGRRVYDPPPLAASRERTQAQLSHLHAGIRRFANPHQYPVGLEQGLFELRQRLVLEARGALS